MSRGVQRIVVIGLSNVGDGVLTVPVIQRLHARYPDAFLTLFVGERAQSIFLNDPRVHQIVCTDEYSGPAGRLGLVQHLWAAKPDVVIDLRNTVLPLLWKPWRAARYLTPPPASIAHMRDRHLWKLRRQDPSRGADDDAAPSAGPIWISDEEADRAERLLERWGVRDERRLVIVCPGARSHIKRWAPERFAAVADQLVERGGAQVVFTGEPAEAPVVEEILKSMRHAGYNATSATTVPQLAAVMRRAALVLTNDSASLHIACAAGAPVVAIFGPTDERKYGPTGPRDRVVRRRLFCAPCEAAQCRFSHECMRYVSVEEVAEAALAVLGEAPAASASERPASPPPTAPGSDRPAAAPAPKVSRAPTPKRPTASAPKRSIPRRRQRGGDAHAG
jgi:ADP-heptose:LPS heptosyltransferase